MNTSAPTGIPEQIETIETAIEMPGLTVHERDCLRATLALLKDGQSKRIADMEIALAWALPMALDWRGSLPPEAWPEFDEDSAQAREALAKSTP